MNNDQKEGIKKQIKGWTGTAIGTVIGNEDRKVKRDVEITNGVNRKNYVHPRDSIGNASRTPTSPAISNPCRASTTLGPNSPHQQSTSLRHSQCYTATADFHRTALPRHAYPWSFRCLSATTLGLLIPNRLPLRQKPGGARSCYAEARASRSRSPPLRPAARGLPVRRAPTPIKSSSR